MRDDKWKIPLDQWNEEQKKEYLEFKELHNIWLESGIWRRTSFKDFVEQSYAIILRS